MTTLNEAFDHTTHEIHNAETALTKALSYVAKAFGNAEFESLMLAHLAETKQQIVILENVSALNGHKAADIKCDAIDGLPKENVGMDATGIALDACLSVVEHHEIECDCTPREWAKVLGGAEAHELLRKIPEMENTANSKLTVVTVSAVDKARKAA